jgi:hypothetical protein
LSVKVPTGQRSVEPPLQDGQSLGVIRDGETPTEALSRMVNDTLEKNGWTQERYGDAVRAVGRQHPELLQAWRAE